MRRLALFVLVLISACTPAWQVDLRRHIALQRGCAEDEIAIIGDNGRRVGRQVRVEACGESLMYESVNTGAQFEWRDITGGGEDAAPYVAQ